MHALESSGAATAARSPRCRAPAYDDARRRHALCVELALAQISRLGVPVARLLAARDRDDRRELVVGRARAPVEPGLEVRRGHAVVCGGAQDDDRASAGCGSYRATREPHLDEGDRRRTARRPPGTAPTILKASLNGQSSISRGRRRPPRRGRRDAPEDLVAPEEHHRLEQRRPDRPSRDRHADRCLGLARASARGARRAPRARRAATSASHVSVRDRPRRRPRGSARASGRRPIALSQRRGVDRRAPRGRGSRPSRGPRRASRPALGRAGRRLGTTDSSNRSAGHGGSWSARAPTPRRPGATHGRHASTNASMAERAEVRRRSGG